ncbi:MAG: diphosphate--fructose-6-phosphate 1-phosphotransferase, partial [Chlamydiales bacterium]|nr:diphosphate--fructose-6-phosphate 1-phosphotransferase [Chlamydiales bacterium]
MLSLLQTARLAYQPLVPSLLEDVSKVSFKPLPVESPPSSTIKYLFPKTCGQAPCALVRQEVDVSRPLQVGVLFSGGQAAGGNNVIAGLFDALQQIHPHSTLVGFLDGPKGILEDRR